MRLLLSLPFASIPMHLLVAHPPSTPHYQGGGEEMRVTRRRGTGLCGLKSLAAGCFEIPHLYCVTLVMCEATATLELKMTMILIQINPLRSLG